MKLTYVTLSLNTFDYFEWDRMIRSSALFSDIETEIDSWDLCEYHDLGVGWSIPSIYKYDLTSIEENWNLGTYVKNVHICLYTVKFTFPGHEFSSNIPTLFCIFFLRAKLMAIFKVPTTKFQVQWSPLNKTNRFLRPVWLGTEFSIFSLWTNFR